MTDPRLDPVTQEAIARLRLIRSLMSGDPEYDDYEYEDDDES